MEKKNLPNATAILILGIFSIITCCCGWGIGIILGVIALVLANKDMKLYNENPDLYLDYKNLNIGKTLAIIGITLSAITFMINVYMWTTMGEEGMQEFMENLQDKMEQMEKDR